MYLPQRVESAQSAVAYAPKAPRPVYPPAVRVEFFLKPPLQEPLAESAKRAVQAIATYLLLTTCVSLLAVDCLLLTTFYLLLTDLLLTAYYSQLLLAAGAGYLLAIACLPLTTYCSLLTSHYSLPFAHYLLLTVYCVLLTTHYLLTYGAGYLLY